MLALISGLGDRHGPVRVKTAEILAELVETRAALAPEMRGNAPTGSVVRTIGSHQDV
jgi:hypothetical protein